MAVISKITTQKNNHERFNIFFKDESGKERYAFAVDQDVLIKYGLSKGIELDKETLNEIVYADEIKKAYNLAIHFLSFRMRSTGEVEQYLKKKEYEAEVIQEVIQKLFKYNFLNDLQFAQAFVRSRKNTSTKGPDVIRKELIEKKVSERDIEQSLKQYTYEEQLEAVINFAEKRIKKEKNRSSKEVRDKVAQSLQLKGFSRDVITEAFNELSFEKSDSEEWEAIQYHGEKAHRKYSKYAGWEYEQRMKTFLMRKRFPYELINKYIEKLKSED